MTKNDDKDISIIQDAKVFQSVQKCIKDATASGSDANIEFNIIGNISVDNRRTIEIKKNGKKAEISANEPLDLDDVMDALLDHVPGPDRYEQVKKLVFQAIVKKFDTQAEMGDFLGIERSTVGMALGRYGVEWTKIHTPKSTRLLKKQNKEE